MRSSCSPSTSSSYETCSLPNVGRRHCVVGRRLAAAAAQTGPVVKAVVLPQDHDQAIRQAQDAVKASIADGHRLIEVDFPTTSIWGVSGDGEGQTEMNQNLGFLRQFMNAFRDQAETTRIFFPDNRELAVAISGQTMDPNAGRVALEPKFADVKFKLGYLVRQNAGFAMMGVNLDRWSCVELTKDSDALYVVGYPSFNPKEELSATSELYEKKAKAKGIPIIIFNGELDRFRGGYYPALFFPTIGKLTNEFLPQVHTAYYIHNFKGSRPGCLFRAYPGPWQVFRRSPFEPDVTKLIWEGEAMPSLKQVSLEILASNLGLA